MWCDSTEQMQYFKIGHQAIINIKKAVDANAISIPFPIRTLDVVWPENSKN